MCGIVGIFNRDGSPIDGQILDRMTAVIRHRGPDGDGRHIDREIALGHRRLSIIDVSGGAQPICNEDGLLHIVFNGEIYNYIELRDQLLAAGHVFKTRSDTEVIVHAYEEWGTDCVRRFNGMFAFAIWNAKERSVFIARDHLGIKPLYYTEIGPLVAFGSEIKALLEVPGCQRAVDLDALSQLFTFRYVPSPLTLFKGIFKLPPGHFATLSAREFTIKRFWTSIPQHRENVRADALAEEYQALLEDAVRLQMRSDVPVGLFLSSGVDSGVLLAIMRKFTNEPIRAFTIGFEGGERTNEVADAAAMARMFGAEHTTQMLSPGDYMRYYDRYMADIEEPVGNETAAAFYFVSQLTQRQVKVALTGQGADEPWAGYHRYRGVKISQWYSRIPRPLTAAVEATVTRIPGRHERLKRGATALAEPDVLTRFAKVYSFFSADMKAQLYSGTLKGIFERDPFGTRMALASWQRDVAHLDALSQVLYMDTRTNLPDDLLMVNDKTSMANSLEARVPFLDYRLVEFVESLPGNLKLRGTNGKYLHKRACEKWLPKEIVYRKKKGFANPVEDWFRQGMKSFVDDCLLSSDSSIATYFDQRYIKTMLDQDRNGTEQYRRHIYLLVSLELWHRTFFSK